MKVSVSLPKDDVEFLDEYARSQGMDSRSAVVHRAVRLLRSELLTSDYEHAWRNWAERGESEVWEASIGDGVSQ